MQPEEPQDNKALPVQLLHPEGPESDRTHHQFWSPAASPSHLQSLFQLTVEHGEVSKEELQLQAPGPRDIAEVFSPPRSTAKRQSYRLLPRYAIDLERGWDLLGKSQVKLDRILDEEDPYLRSLP